MIAAGVGPMLLWRTVSCADDHETSARVRRVLAARRVAQVRQNYRAAREFTMQAFKDMGYRFTESQANFLFVDVRRPIREFRDACAKEKILLARDFPSMPTWSRISIGTLDQMKEALPLFRKVLGSAPTA